MNTWVQNNWLVGVAIVMVGLVLVSTHTVIGVLPYAFYQLMNWAVVGASLMLAFQGYKKHMQWVVWLFAVVAVVFNPISPMYFTPLVWQIADVAAILFFVASFFFVQKN